MRRARGIDFGHGSETKQRPCRVVGAEVKFSRTFKRGLKHVRATETANDSQKVPIKSLCFDGIHVLFALGFLCDSFGLDLCPAGSDRP